MEIVNGHIKVSINGKKISKSFDVPGFHHDEFVVELKKEDHRIHLTISPDQPMVLEDVYIELDNKFGSKDRIFCNGFQSWTASAAYTATDRFKKYKWFIQKYTRPFGDHSYINYSQKKGYLHAWDFGYVRKTNDRIHLLGSKDTENGFTCIEFICPENKIRIRKDCTGLQIDKPFDLLDIFISEGAEDTVFDKYFEFQGKENAGSDHSALPAAGWTSWYHYFHHIDEKIALKNLHQYKLHAIPIDYFQIDDGWQESIGDWLEPNKKFPAGMKAMSSMVHDGGFKSGLWLSPFVCERKSSIFKKKKTWLLKDHHDKPVKAGFNPRWGGTFYALDIYNDEFRAYLKEVFEKILHEWKFDMVKLDFLYAVCLIGRKDKTRGTIMTEAMTFIRNLCHGKMILGCGVPLLPAAGNVDYCRIGPDIGMSWEDKILSWLGLREGISTIQSLRNTISRYQLNGRWFYNDPDVFILRREKNKLTSDQKFTVFLTNQIFGNLLFTSDDISMYDDATLNLYRSSFPVFSKHSIQVDDYHQLYKVSFSIGDREYIASINLTSLNQVVELPNGIYYNGQGNEIIGSGSRLNLKPFQTKILYKIKSEPYQILGGKNHLFSGCEVSELSVDGAHLNLTLFPHSMKKYPVLLSVPKGVRDLDVNGKRCVSEERNGLHLMVYPG